MSRQKVIILDAGHGGISPHTGKYVTPGKCSPIWPDGSIYYEGVGNRDIIHRMSQYLKGLGWKVLFTVHPTDYRDISLQNRIATSNRIFKKNLDAFQISIHSNGFSNPDAHGCEVITSPGQTASDPMATTILNELLSAFNWLEGRTDKRDGDPDKEINLAMNRVNCPSVLVETMFHTNPKECEFLMSDNGREQIAIALVEAIEKIHHERN